MAPVVHIIAAGPLPAALQQVAHDGALAQLVPVLQGPAKLVDERSQEQRAVRRAAGNHRVRTLVDARLDPLVADVGVAVVNFVGDFGELPLAVQVGERPAVLQKLWDPRLDVVAGDIPDLIPLQPLALGPVSDGVHAALDIHAPGVGNQPDVPLLGRAPRVL